MIAASRAPGVRFEWVDDRANRIDEPRTDVAGLVGIAARGPLHRPVRVESWLQFVSRFGGHIPQGYLAYAVEGFFANGGRVCWVVRVADPARAGRASLLLHDGEGTSVLRLEAVDEGTWGQAISASVVPTRGDRFNLTLGGPAGEREFWPDLTLTPGAQRFVVDALAAPERPSNLVRAALVKGAPAAENLQAVRAALEKGDDGVTTLSVEHFMGAGTNRWGLAALAEVDEVSIVAVPDIMPKEDAAPPQAVRIPRCEVPVAVERDVEASPPGSKPSIPAAFDATQILLLQNAVVGECARLADRVAILDPAPFEVLPDEVLARRRLFDTSYGSLCFPWLRVPDPLQLTGLLRSVPPSGHLAGIYARGDLAVGVHKPPANEVIEGAHDLTVVVDETTHGFLNEQGVNVIRPFPGRGLRVVGARTLASDAALRYVNVRRLLTWIAESIEEGVQWTAFEPSDPNLWSVVSREVRALLEGLWRRGMLDGATREDAYTVQCDDTTNPHQEVESGRLICLVGVRPPWPAEFITVRIGRTVSGLEILAVEGGSLG